MKVLDNTKPGKGDLCPCDGCGNYKQCGDEEIACQDFYHYTRQLQLRNRVPNKYYYKLTFGED